MARHFDGLNGMQSWEARGALRQASLWTPTGKVVGPYPSNMGASAMMPNVPLAKNQAGLYVPDKPKLWAAPLSNGSSVMSGLTKLFPALMTVNKSCPSEICKNTSWGKASHPLSDVIIHLNDHHRWPREKVADWLEVISTDNPDINLTIVGGNNGASAEAA